MLDQLGDIAAACDLTIAAEHRLPVAIVGAGTIVDVAHLPVYRRAGLEVTGVYDRDAARAAEVAARHGVRTYDSLEQLLDDPDPQVVDIAVLPAAQPEIARRAAAAGKHVLCQKPLAPTAAEAAALCGDVRDVKLAVNQQLRFDEGIMAAKAIIEQGWIGTPTAATFSVDILTDWGVWPWLVTSPKLEILFHSIHYLDALRYLLGEPNVVFCAAGRRPGQEAAGETRTASTLLFDDGVIGLVHSNHENLGEDRRAEWRIDGSEGSVRGTLGLLYDYPRGRPDTLEVFSRTLPTDGWLPYPVTTRWIPDAFAGPIGSLLRAIHDGGDPLTSGVDNVRTLALAEALYRSVDERAAQVPEVPAVLCA
jgi:predicted dehydrogenase